MKLALLSIFLAVPLVAQTAKAPTIPDSLTARFWKANATMTQANAEIEAAKQRLQSAKDSYTGIIKEMQDACGKDFQPQMDQKGDPACVAKAKK